MVLCHIRSTVLKRKSIPVCRIVHSSAFISPTGLVISADSFFSSYISILLLDGEKDRERERERERDVRIDIVLL